jgi:glycosyltransferase involved in cell wall biosynthesis
MHACAVGPVREETGPRRKPEGRVRLGCVVWGGSMAAVRKAAAFLIVLVILVAVRTAVRIGRFWRGIKGDARPSARGVRVLVTGTFYNPGWFRSHILPLSLCRDVKEIWVVSDSALEAVSKVRYAVPPHWLVRLVSRAPARLLWVLCTARREGCDVLMGYHIMPNALLCLIAAALLGRRAIYQMTGGPGQVIGGGAASENVLLRQLGRESRFLECRLIALVRAFDAVIVRGSKARRFLEAYEVTAPIGVLTGCVDPMRFSGEGLARYDVIFVGRLVPAKGCELLQEVLASLIGKRPATSVAIVGEGPLQEPMMEYLSGRGALSRITFMGRRDDVPQLLAESRVFLLTSPDEGMSIALLEAMSTGVVPVVPDVGELSDAVRHGENGLLVSTRRAEDFMGPISTLLEDEAFRKRLSVGARMWARANVAPSAVAERWQRLFDELFSVPLGESV